MSEKFTGQSTQSDIEKPIQNIKKQLQKFDTKAQLLIQEEIEMKENVCKF